jgi:molybdopterin synthase sulfur carrier subunit
MRVDFYATLRQIVGTKTVDFPLPDGSTVGHLLEEVFIRYPAMRSELLDDEGQLHGHVHVLVNGRSVPYLENIMNTVIHIDDTISIFPAVGGG